MKRKIFLIFIALALLAVSAWRYLKISDGQLGEADKNIPTPTVEVVTEQLDNKIPSEFPDDFPEANNAQVISSWSTEKNTIRGISVVWETKESPQAVFDFYKKELVKVNYELINTMDDSLTLTFRKDKVSGIVGITEGENGKTTISVTMGIE